MLNRNAMSEGDSCYLSGLRLIKNGLARGTARFKGEEDGSLIVFGLVLFLLMAMMGGLAVDLMRFEQRRTEMQQTLDRSVLAAAALSQRLPAKEVVEDYFAKAGLSEYLEEVNTPSGLNYRRVTAKAKATIDPFFLHLVGIDHIDAVAASTAEQNISNVEVSLVLDVSGSMSGARINALKPAAIEFVNSILNASQPGRVTISLVPYAQQVNPGEALFDQLAIPRKHSNSFCVEMQDSVFSSPTLTPGSTGIKHHGHFDAFSYDVKAANRFHCPSSVNEIIPLSDNASALETRINSLTAGGNTAIDVGTKWGTALLDKGSQGIVSGLIGSGKVKGEYVGRPLDPAVNDVLKVLVVMTDGQNTTEYRLNDAYYNSNYSNIWKRKSDGVEWLYYNRPSTSYDYYNTSNRSWYSSLPGNATNDYIHPTWTQVWAAYSVDWVAWYFDSVPNGTSFNSNWYKYLSAHYANKDNNLSGVCKAARDNDIIVYGIGFDAPTNGRAALLDCASSPGHYFDASTTGAALDISDVFRTIASNISQLRLTQ